MHLISKEEYRRLQSTRAEHDSLVNSIKGNISGGQINHIEISDGGRVVIKPTDVTASSAKPKKVNHGRPEPAIHEGEFIVPSDRDRDGGNSGREEEGEENNNNNSTNSASFPPSIDGSLPDVNAADNVSLPPSIEGSLPDVPMETPSHWRERGTSPKPPETVNIDSQTTPPSMKNVHTFANLSKPPMSHHIGVQSSFPQIDKGVQSHNELDIMRPQHTQSSITSSLIENAQKAVDNYEKENQKENPDKGSLAKLKTAAERAMSALENMDGKLQDESSHRLSTAFSRSEGEEPEPKDNASSKQYVEKRVLRNSTVQEKKHERNLVPVFEHVLKDVMSDGDAPMLPAPDKILPALAELTKREVSDINRDGPKQMETVDMHFPEQEMTRKSRSILSRLQHKRLMEIQGRKKRLKAVKFVSDSKVPLIGHVSRVTKMKRTRRGDKRTIVKEEEEEEEESEEEEDKGRANAKGRKRKVGLSVSKRRGRKIAPKLRRKMMQSIKKRTQELSGIASSEEYSTDEEFISEVNNDKERPRKRKQEEVTLPRAKYNKFENEQKRKPAPLMGREKDDHVKKYVTKKKVME